MSPMKMSRLPGEEMSKSLAFRVRIILYCSKSDHCDSVMNVKGEQQDIPILTPLCPSTSTCPSSPSAIHCVIRVSPFLPSPKIDFSPLDDVWGVFVNAKNEMVDRKMASTVTEAILRTIW